MFIFQSWALKHNLFDVWYHNMLHVVTEHHNYNWCLLDIIKLQIFVSLGNKKIRPPFVEITLCFLRRQSNCLIKPSHHTRSSSNWNNISALASSPSHCLPLHLFLSERWQVTDKWTIEIFSVLVSLSSCRGSDPTYLQHYICQYQIWPANPTDNKIP